MTINLSELKEKAEKSLPGPWDYIEVKGFPTINLHNMDVHYPWFDLCCDTTAQFIASANPDTVLKLIQALELAREGLKEYVQVCAKTVNGTGVFTATDTLTQLLELVTWGDE